jgi:hypothetical protein
MLSPGNSFILIDYCVYLFHFALRFPVLEEDKQAQIQQRPVCWNQSSSLAAPLGLTQIHNDPCYEFAHTSLTWMCNKPTFGHFYACRISEVPRLQKVLKVVSLYSFFSSGAQM